MHYNAHEYLVAAARPSAQLWRLALGLVIIVACFLAMGYSYFNLLAELVTKSEWPPQLAAEIDKGSTPPRGMFVILGGYFGLLTLSLMLVTNQLHHRQLRTLIGPPRKALLDFLRVSVALCALATLLWILPEPENMTTSPGLPPPLRWLALLPCRCRWCFFRSAPRNWPFAAICKASSQRAFPTR